MGQEKRTSDVLNINDGLNKVILPANEITRIYSPSDSNGKYGYVNFNILNINSIPADINIWVSSKNNPSDVSDVDLIEFTIQLKSNGGLFVRNNFLVGSNEVIYVRSNIGNVITRLDGTIYRK